MSWLLNAASKAMDVGASLVDQITEVDGPSPSPSPAPPPPVTTTDVAAARKAPPSADSQPQWDVPAVAPRPPPPPKAVALPPVTVAAQPVKKKGFGIKSTAASSTTSATFTPPPRSPVVPEPEPQKVTPPTSAEQKQSSSLWGNVVQSTLFSAIEAGAGALIDTLDAANSALDRASTSSAGADAAARLRELHSFSTSSSSQLSFEACYEELARSRCASDRAEDNQTLLNRRLLLLMERIFDLRVSASSSSSAHDDEEDVLKSIFSLNGGKSRGVAEFAAGASQSQRRIDALAHDFASTTRSSYHAIQNSNRAAAAGDDDAEQSQEEKAELDARVFAAEMEALSAVSATRLREFMSEWVDAMSHELHIFSQLSETALETLASSSSSLSHPATTNLGQITMRLKAATAVDDDEQEEYTVALLAFVATAIQHLETATAAALEMATSATLSMKQRWSSVAESEAKWRRVQEQEQQQQKKTPTMVVADDLIPFGVAVTEFSASSRRAISRWAGAAVALAEECATESIRRISAKKRAMEKMLAEKKNTTKKEKPKAVVDAAPVPVALPSAPTAAAVDDAAVAAAVPAKPKKFKGFAPKKS